MHMTAWHGLPNWRLSLKLSCQYVYFFTRNGVQNGPQLGALYLQFSFLLWQFQPIFMSFVTISSVLCHCFKAMLLVVILPWKGLMSNEPVVVWEEWVHSWCMDSTGPSKFRVSQNINQAGLSKVAGCWRKSPHPWSVLASYSARHFFTDGVF